MQNFNPEILGLFVVGAVEAALVFLMYLKTKFSRSTLLFSFFTLAVFSWVSTMIVFQVIPNDSRFLLLSGNLLYLSAGLMPIFFVLFSYFFPTEKSSLSNKKKFFIITPAALAICSILIPGFLIEGIVPGVDTKVKIIKFGYGHIFYMAYAISYFVWGCVNLFKKYRKSSGAEKVQIGYVLWGTFIPTIIDSYTNLIGPSLGDFRFFWLGPVVTVTMPIAVTYAIFRHRLFDLKVILTEIISLFILFALAVQIFLSVTLTEIILKIVVLIFVYLLLYFLVKSIGKEIVQRKEMEEIAKRLEDANIHLRNLDQQKSEFVSIASHQLRTPITAIKGYSSMLLEGSFGKLEPKNYEAIQKIMLSSDHLVGIVEDFLNISRIEQGRMVYDLVSVDIRKMIEVLVADYNIRAAQKGQKVEFLFDYGQDYLVVADEGKIRQVISNLIDNGIKYSEQDGTVKIRLFKNSSKGKIVVSVTDTGIGMSEKTLKLLFQKFSRAEGVQRLYTEGTGLGLYVASEMMKVHRGRIWAESGGEGKGSTFFLELMSAEGNVYART